MLLVKKNDNSQGHLSFVWDTSLPQYSELYTKYISVFISFNFA